MPTLNIPKSDLPRIVIIGAGFGGLKLLTKLVKAEKYQIVIIDKRNFHTFQPLLYQVSSFGLSPEAIAYPLRKTVKIKTDTAFFRMGEVERIDADNKTVFLDRGEITYDYLVIATGSKTNFFGNKEIETHAMRMKTVAQAVNIRSLILENLEQATITKDTERRKALLNFVIAGAGPTGVELSGAIAEIRKNVVPHDYIDIDPKEMHIHLLEGQDRVLPPMSAKSSKAARKALEKMGVELHLGSLVQSFDGKIVKTNDGQVYHTDTFVWTAGVTGTTIEGLKENAVVPRANRYKVDAYNRVEGYTDIFAIGDAALMQNEDYPRGYPMMAQPAIQQGKNLAKNFLRMLAKKELKPFNYFDKGAMATIGRNRAVVDMKHLHFSGFLAWLVWMSVHLWFIVGFGNRVAIFLSWAYRYINYDRANRLIIRPFKINRVALDEKD